MSDRTRRLARRRRNERERDASQEPPRPTPVNTSRLRQLFTNLSFRSHENGGTRPFEDFVVGRSVIAKSPEEPAAATDEAHAEEALRQTPS